MNQKFKLSAPVVFLLLAISSWGTAPVVSNVSVQQRSGTELVDINYTLTLDSNVTANVGLWFSSDNGANYSIKCETVTGDIGAGISAGNRSVVWDAGADWDNRFTNNGKIRVIARNGDLEPELNSTLSGISDSAPLVIWDKTLGGSGNELLKSVTLTPSGDLLVLGTSDSNSSGDKSENSKGDKDFWMVKIDENGSKIWDKTMGGSYFEQSPLIKSTNDGKYIIAGSSRSEATGDKSDVTNGGQDYWVIKIDENGSKIWDKSIGGPHQDVATGLTTNLDNEIVVAGNSRSFYSGGDKTEEGEGEWDFWIVKLDADGNKLWDQTIGGNGNDSFASISVNHDGSFIVAGSSESNATGDKSEDSKGGSDIWIVKLDADGNKLWDKTIGGNGNDSPGSLSVNHDGSFIVSSSSESNATGDKSEDSKGGSDFWIVKLDADGNKLWDKTIGGNGNDSPGSLSVNHDGSFIVAGSSESNATGDKSEESIGGSADFWVVGMDAIGNKLWDKTIGGSGLEYHPKIISGHDGNFYIAGKSDSNATGDKSQDCKGLLDYWIIKLEAEL